MSNVYEICFYGGLVLAIIFLIVSIVLFFVLRIPKVFGELTGRAAKKGIREKQQGKSNVGETKREKYYNQNSGKITVRDAVSQETKKANKDDTTDNLTKEVDMPNNPSFEPQFNPDETAVLGLTSEMDKKIHSAVNVAATEVLNPKKPNDVDTEVLGATKRMSDDYENDKAPVGDDSPTDVLTVEEYEMPTDVLKGEEDDETPTDVLITEEDDETPTDVLITEESDEAPTDVLRADNDEIEETDDEEEESTSILTSKKTLQLAHKAKVIYNIVVVHTNENI